MRDINYFNRFRRTTLVLLSIYYLLCTGCDDATTIPNSDESNPGNIPSVMNIDMGENNDPMTPLNDQQTIPNLADMNVAGDLTVGDTQIPIEPPAIPVRAEVQLATVTTAAGIENRISCIAYDEMGNTVEDIDHLGRANFDIRPLDGWIQNEEDAHLFQGIQAGEYQVRCQLPQWGLRSEQASWQVLAGMPVRSIAQLSQQDIRAGESVELTCAVFDAWDNRISTQEYSDRLNMEEGEEALPVVEWSMTPALPDVLLEGGQWEFTQAGEFDFQCNVNGVSESYASQLLVRPGLPASLSAELDQGKTQYFFNEIVTVNYVVNDLYDNEIDGVAISVSSNPAMQSFGDRRFLAQDPGSYQINVAVTGATHEDLPLNDTLTIYVDDGAPSIQCTTPNIGEMRSEAAFFLSGNVSEASGLAEVTVDGESVSVDAQGTFRKRVTPTWGLNIHELAARDEFGQVNTALCIFFASDHYLNSNTIDYMEDVALLHISQAAIDDGAPRVPRESFGDLLHAIINSSALLSTIDQALSAQNPIVNTSYEIACVPFLGCATVTARAYYDELAINGSRTIDLDLISGGLNIQTTLNNIRLDLSTYLSGAGVTIRPSGYVTVSSLSLDMNVDLGLNGQTPTVTLRGTPSITIGNIDLQLDINNSILSAIVNPFTNLVFSLFESLVRNTLVTQMRSYLSTEFDSLLSGILGSLDLSNLSLDLDLPHPLGGSPISLNVFFGLNRIEANSTRLKVGIKSRVTSSSRHNRTTPGIPTPEVMSNLELNPGIGRDSAGSTHVALFNAVLYRLWKAGMFDISDISSLIGNQTGIDITFQTLTPPAIELQSPGNKIKLHFGPALAQVSYPGFFDEPVSIYLAAYATAQVSIDNNNELSFGSLSVQDLKLSGVGLTLTPDARLALQGTFTDILQSLFDTSLNQALPTLPIPEFALPNSFSQYGIPNNTRLGVRNIRLYRVNQTLQAKGNFGL